MQLLAQEKPYNWCTTQTCLWPSQNSYWDWNLTLKRNLKRELPALCRAGHITNWRMHSSSHMSLGRYWRCLSCWRQSCMCMLPGMRSPILIFSNAHVAMNRRSTNDFLPWQLLCQIHWPPCYACGTPRSVLCSTWCWQCHIKSSRKRCCSYMKPPLTTAALSWADHHPFRQHHFLGTVANDLQQCWLPLFAHLCFSNYFWFLAQMVSYLQIVCK